MKSKRLFFVNYFEKYFPFISFQALPQMNTSQRTSISSLRLASVNELLALSCFRPHLATDFVRYGIVYNSKTWINQKFVLNFRMQGKCGCS